MDAVSNNIVRNIVVGILVVVVLFFVSRSLGGSARVANSDVFKQILELTKKNEIFIAFQKDIMDQIIKTKDNLDKVTNNTKALEEYAIVIDQSIAFEGYAGYTGIPYDLNFKKFKHPKKPPTKEDPSHLQNPTLSR
jgi:hypothetical protein